MWSGAAKTPSLTDPRNSQIQKVMATTATATPDAAAIVEAAQEATAITSCKE